MVSTYTAISVRNLSKVYAIGREKERHSTLAESLLHKLRYPGTAFRKAKEIFYALKDISFDIEKGQVVGIIGRNGAGKSTLLKILSRITEPTAGEINLYGRVGSLLEVGTGFHPELTGRENIYLNGAILGMQRQEISRQFDAIVDFAGVEQFLDTPVKRYSSGMYVRLAFAVAAHLQSEILVVDEVLAVGDAEFQRKCLGKMKDVATDGRTVLLVSHHIQSIAVLCDQVIYLESGTCPYIGAMQGGIEKYLSSFQQRQSHASDMHRRPGTGELRFTVIDPVKEQFTGEEEKAIDFVIERQRPFNVPFFVSCHIVDPHGRTLLQCDSRMVREHFGPAETVRGRFSFGTPWLKPGSYRVDFFLCANGVLDRYESACTLNILPLSPYPATYNPDAAATGIVFADFSYTEGVSLSK